MNFNLEDYAPVEERLHLFLGEHPEGRVITEMVRLEPPLVVFRAEVYVDHETDRPKATGYAYEKEGAGPVNRTSYVENCETSAVGRALANAGYQGKRSGSPRPSREEMEKVARTDELETHRQAWVALMKGMEATDGEVEAFALLHPKVPDNVADWTVDHFKAAGKTIQKRGKEALQSALKTHLDKIASEEEAK